MGVLLALPGIAFADCNPRPSDQNTNQYNWGQYRPAAAGDWYQVVKADILVKSPHMGQALNADTSYSWVMMTDTSLGQWAQVGPMKWGGTNGRGDYWQCYNTTTGDFDQLKFGQQTVGTTHTYKVTGTSGGPKDFYVDGSASGGCPFTFTPNIAEANSEIHDEATQVPGTSSDHETFTNAQAQNDHNVWKDFFDSTSNRDGDNIIGGNKGYTKPSWFGQTAPVSGNTQTENTWDGDCP